MALLKQDLTDVQPLDERNAIPAGEYQAIIIESGGKSEDPATGDDGLVSAKSGKGRYLPLVFEICEGDYKGRKLWTRLNLENVNQQAVEIARRELKSILTAIGWDFGSKPCGPEDSSEMHMIPLTIKVKTVPNRETGELQNEIANYKPRQTATFSGGATSGTAPAAAPAAPPWEANKK